MSFKKNTLNKNHIVFNTVTDSVSLVFKIDDAFSEGDEGEFYESDKWEYSLP